MRLIKPYALLLRRFGAPGAPDLLLLVILGLAALLRLGWPAITEFKADEARLLSLALDMAEFKSFALRGIGSSVGLPNFAMSVWLFSIPLLFWKHPYAATLFVGLLNTLAVYVCYRLARRYWGMPAAWTAAFMFAVSPWAVIYSRKIWAQDLLPLFVLGCVGAALAAFVDGRRWALLAHIVLLSVVIQIHLSGVALLPFTALLLIIFWRRSRAARGEIVLGIVFAGLLAAPFGIWLARQTGGGPSPLAAALTGRADVDLDALRYAWLVWGGFDIHSLAGPNAFREYLGSVPDIDLVRWGWGLLAVGGLAVAVWRRRPADLILALWLVVPVLFFIRHSTPVFPHYFIVTLPAAYMLAGVLVEALAKAAARYERAVKLSAGGLIGASALVQVAVWLALLFFIAGHDTTGGFGTPLGSLLATVDAATAARTARSSPEVLVVGAGDDPSVQEFPAVMDVLLRGAPHRFVNGLESAVLPRSGAIVVLESPHLAAAERYYSRCAACALLWSGDHGLAVVALEPDAASHTPLPREFPEPRRLANGVELLAWQAEPGWAIYWRVGYIPPAADYHFFNHARDVQADGVGYPSRYWRDGDIVISFFDLPATGPVRVGMYEYPGVINVPVMDAAGNPYSDALTAGP